MFIATKAKRCFTSGQAQCSLFVGMYPPQAARFAGVRQVYKLFVPLGLPSAERTHKADPCSHAMLGNEPLCQPNYQSGHCGF
jgi:hypothetical protein